MTEEYKVQLDVFEGPLDLLLYLIKKEEIDISISRSNRSRRNTWNT